MTDILDVEFFDLKLGASVLICKQFISTVIVLYSSERLYLLNLHCAFRQHNSAFSGLCNWNIMKAPARNTGN